jgi:pimeloyl-ACP methyl ester carboxylesterase
MAENLLEFAWEGLTLAGSLRLPDERGPHPIVVMIQGSGPSDRTSNGYFLPIQDAYLARGIGTFAFDKPGCGASTGDWRVHALEARADQIIAAVHAVREHPEVRADGTGIWGQSQGGWLVQMLAGRLVDLPFAIASSGPSINVQDQNLYGCEHTMRANGHSATEIKHALRFLTEMHEAAMDGLSYEAVNARFLEPAIGQSWYGYFTITDAEDWQGTCRFVREGYDPIQAMRRIQVPYLAVYGGRDVLVPAWQSAEETGLALQRAGNSDATVVVFPNGDHRIQDASASHFVAGYLDLLVNWTVRRV